MTEFKAGDRIKIIRTNELWFTAGDTAILKYRDSDGDWLAEFSNGREQFLQSGWTEFELVEKPSAQMFKESFERHLKDIDCPLNDGVYYLPAFELINFFRPMFIKAGYSLAEVRDKTKFIKVRRIDGK